MRFSSFPIRTFVSLAAVALSACASSEGDRDGVAGSESALVSLTPASCVSPNVSSTPKLDPEGKPMSGAVHATLSACIVAKDDETGAGMLDRATALLSDVGRFAALKDEVGDVVFRQYAPLPPTGDLATGLVQDVDVVLNLKHSPSCRLRTTRRQGRDGTYTLTITNLTALKATVAVFPVTVVEPDQLSATARLMAQANGISVSGTTDVTLLKEQAMAAQAGQLARQVFDWLAVELAKP